MSKKQNKNKRAFTLTELLIVVIVIGVLSAVTLPKFTRVIENRKVTEAEEMMSAVRTEQERRCAMDKPYTLNFDNLSDVVSSSNTKNYTYSLQAEGVSATSNKGDYTLKMLSYQDGSFCCEGDDCTKLNKNYPSCDGLTFPSSGCEGSDGDGSEIGTDPTPSSSCTDGQVRGSQSCNTCGVQTTQACVGGRWVSQLGECSKTVAECDTPECTNGAVGGSQSCNGCGTQFTKQCVNGRWVDFAGECSKTVEECADDSCKDKFSSWTPVTGDASDTCPGGDSMGEFVCNGTYAGTCTDVRATADDKLLGRTTTKEYDPPSGYDWGRCSNTARAENKKAAVPVPGGEHKDYTQNSAEAVCVDVSEGYEKPLDSWALYMKDNKTGKVIKYFPSGSVQECPMTQFEITATSDTLCKALCGVSVDDNKGCSSLKRCYLSDGYNSTCHGVGVHYGFIIYTCDVGAGGWKYFYDLYQCGFKYEKRTVSCCAR